jgi:S-adenosylmethionine uptake transporter
MAPEHTKTPRVTTGIGLAIAGNACFAIQDAIVKWLVTSHSVWQILFVRSIVIMALAGLATKGSVFRASMDSRNRMALALRAALLLLAWLSYYSAARRLALAELVTLYFTSPIFVVILSIPILKERITPARWMAVIVGFAGVVLVANPRNGVDLVPAGMVVFAALAWGLTSILARLISRTETTATQMLTSNLLFVVSSAVTLPWNFSMPNFFNFVLMLSLGFAGGLGQYLVFESVRHAPASVIAPFQFSALLWAFLLGFLVWHDIPPPIVFVGASLSIAGGVGLLFAEKMRPEL